MLKSASMSFLFVVISFLVIAGAASTKGEVIDIAFGQPPVSDSDESRSLESVTGIQGRFGNCQSGLFLMTHYGDRENLFQKEHRSMIDNPLRNRVWRYCSVFRATDRDTVIVGQNWDNENVGSIIVSLYQPPGRYSSICFSRAIDMDFPLHIDLHEIRSTDMGKKLLLAPFYSMDGMNEHGLVVGLAGNKETILKHSKDKETIFVTYLIRKILDEAKTIEEAVDLVDKCAPFTLDTNSFAGHFLIADASGRSVVLEFDQDQWRTVYSDKPWQAMSTKPIHNVTNSTRKEQCWRYRTMSETLESELGNDWEYGLKLLQDVSQAGTTWSVVYSPTTKELYFSVYQDWDTIYHLTFP